MPTSLPSATPTHAPTHIECYDICQPALANISTEIIWMSAGILNEVDNIIDALKPKFYLSELSVTPSSKNAPVVEQYGEAMAAEIASVVTPIKEASGAFLALYDSKLDTLFASVGLEGADKALAHASRVNLASEPPEVLADRAEVGVGVWVSYLATMAAVVGGVFFESYRTKRYPAEL